QLARMAHGRQTNRSIVAVSASSAAERCRNRSEDGVDSAGGGLHTRSRGKSDQSDHQRVLDQVLALFAKHQVLKFAVTDPQVSLHAPLSPLVRVLFLAGESMSERRFSLLRASLPAWMNEWNGS